jgi:hypothetical protein
MNKTTYKKVYKKENKKDGYKKENKKNDYKKENTKDDYKKENTKDDYKKDKTNFIVNSEIQDKKFYLPYKDEDIAKKHLKSYHNEQFKTLDIINNNIKLIEGEEEFGVKKVCVGGVLITNSKIGTEYIQQFNKRQKEHINNRTFSHKMLCERKDEAVALMFLTVYDLLGDYIDSYKKLSDRELCSIVRNNIQIIVEQNYKWVINFSKHIIRDYYSMSPNRLKIKLNFILDDGVYRDELESSNNELDDYLLSNKGGLLLNGIIEELLYYHDELSHVAQDEFGFICQVLCPSGLPENKKWIQIDVGITFSGKRKFKESIRDALIREAREEAHLEIVDNNVIDNAFDTYNTKLYYGGVPKGLGFDGFEIHFWEIFYTDQIKLIDEDELNTKFCKCSIRQQLIETHREKIKKIQLNIK